MSSRALQRKLAGHQDSRGPVGIYSRGKAIYNGASNSAHSGGGPQFGRPRTKIQMPEQEEKEVTPSFGLVDMNPKPINLMGAVQRRLKNRGK